MCVKVIHIYLVIISFFLLSVCMANDENFQQRDYTFVVAPSYEMEIVSHNSESLNRLFQDTYTKDIGPLIGNNTARYWLGESWAVFWTYMYIIWPHESGHWIRGKQGAGDFIFHNYALPFPYTTVDMAPEATLEDEILISIGGFEINSLMARQAEVAFYEKRYSYSDTMINSLVHKLFFPLYSFVVFPADPEKADTWVNTAGDPVHFVLPTYERFTGRPAVKSDGSVDDTLIGFFREATYASLLWNMLDPFLYQSAYAFTDKTKTKPFSARPWLFGDYTLGWIYGTLFNPSPLGYELYFNNYLYLDDRLYVLTLKYGRPFKNNAVGLYVPRLYQKNKVSVNVDIEVWDQDIYGIGGGVGSTLRYRYSNDLTLLFKAELKDRGYQLGKRIKQWGAAFVGLSYHL